MKNKKQAEIVMGSAKQEDLKKLIDLTDALAARKALYDELEVITLQLQEQGFKHAIFDGMDITLVDNFEEKNVQWRMAAVRRYEAKIKVAK